MRRFRSDYPMAFTFQISRPDYPGEWLVACPNPFLTAGGQEGTDEDGEQLGSGVYLNRLTSGGKAETRKLVL